MGNHCFITLIIHNINAEHKLAVMKADVRESIIKHIVCDPLGWPALIS